MKFGVFIAPFHSLRDNPTLAIERELDLIEHCDRLGYDEAWVGEHHSTGIERITDPFQILAAAARQTRRIELGTGVVSLPYHHPMMVADRLVLLDHLSRGRALCGVGPGALIPDADMMGIAPTTQRSRMNESLDAIVKLLAGETVSAKTDWFELREAQLSLLPYRDAPMPIAVASTISPSGVVAAGRHGVGVLSLSAGIIGGRKNMREQWAIGEKTAAEAGKQMNRAEWRMVLRVHVAEDREQAIRDVSAGRLAERKEYFKEIMGLENDYTLEDEIADDCSLVGSPTDVIAAIERIQQETDGFGTLLIMAHNWANKQNTFNSYELFARYVMPHFQGTLDAGRRSAAAITEKRPYYRSLAGEALVKAFNDAGKEIPAGTNLQSLR